MPNDYSVEVFKADKRCHSGERLVEKFDCLNVEKNWLIQHCNTRFNDEKYRFAIFETWVTKKNLMSGVEFKERYDTPYYCSPSSESYWSM